MRRVSVIFFGFWIFSVNGTLASQFACPSVNLYEEPDSPLRIIPLYNQGRAGICYAIAGATLVNYNQVIDSRNKGQAWEPLSVEDFALQSQGFFSTSLDSGFFASIQKNYCKQSETDRTLRYFQGKNGDQITPIEILLVIQDYHNLSISQLSSFCKSVQSEVPGMRECTFKSDKDRVDFIRRISARKDLNERYNQYLDRNLSIAIEFMMTHQATFGRLAFCSENQNEWIHRERVRAFIDPQLKDSNFLSVLKRLFKSCENPKNQVAVSYSTTEFLDYFLELPDNLLPSCIEMRNRSGDCLSRVRGSMRRLSNGYTWQAADQIQRAWFQSSPKQPIYLRMHGDVLKNRKSIGPEDHSVVLAGQRMKQGRCQWLIRNSWGNRGVDPCKQGVYDPAWECTFNSHGDEIGVWVDRSAILERNKASLTFIQR